MNIKFNWAAASALAAIFSLASMPAYAQSTLVSAESGKLVPIDGAWEFPGCGPDDELPPEEQFDEKEFLVYDGDTVESRVVRYSSKDSSCTGDETVVTEGPFFFRSLGQVQSFGWLLLIEDDFENIVDFIELEPPLRQDFQDTLKFQPDVTVLEYIIDEVTGETETDIVYIDDSGEFWFLYRGEMAEIDTGFGIEEVIVMSRDEPLRKADLGPKPECEIVLSQDTYVDGDTITADVFRLSNPTAERVALEVKVWLGKPDESVKSIVNIGAYGFFRVLAETDIDLGPLWLGTVWPHKPRGEYELSCRVLEPKTGKRIAEDINHFVIE